LVAVRKRSQSVRARVAAPRTSRNQATRRWPLRCTFNGHDELLLDPSNSSIVGVGNPNVVIRCSFVTNGCSQVTAPDGAPWNMTGIAALDPTHAKLYLGAADPNTGAR
jgi:hypothetical protein